jgi:hypothetical protein
MIWLSEYLDCFTPNRLRLFYEKILLLESIKFRENDFIKRSGCANKKLSRLKTTDLLAVNQFGIYHWE